MIYVAFKNGKIISIKNPENCEASDIIKQIKDTGFIRIYNLIVACDEILYILEKRLGGDIDE